MRVSLKDFMSLASLEFVASMDPQMADAIEKMLAKAIHYAKREKRRQ